MIHIRPLAFIENTNINAVSQSDALEEANDIMGDDPPQDQVDAFVEHRTQEWKDDVRNHAQETIDVAYAMGDFAPTYVDVEYK